MTDPMYSRAYCLDSDCDWHVESDTVDPAIDRKADRHCKNEKHGTVSGLERKEGPRANRGVRLTQGQA